MANAKATAVANAVNICRLGIKKIKPPHVDIRGIIEEHFDIKNPKTNNLICKLQLFYIADKGNPRNEAFIPYNMLENIEMVDFMFGMLTLDDLKFDEETNFKLCLFVLSFCREFYILPEIETLAIKFVEAHYAKYLNWLQSNVPIPKWWVNIKSLNMLLKASEITRCISTKHIQQFITLLNIIESTHQNYSIDVKFNEFIDSHNCYINWFEDIKQWNPMSLTDPNGFVFYNKKARDPPPIPDDKICEKNGKYIWCSPHAKVQCAKCDKYYTIRDTLTNLETITPLCRMCRNETSKHPDRYVCYTRTCKTCKQQWQYGAKLNEYETWECATCYMKPSAKIGVRLYDLLLNCINVRKLLANSFELNLNIINAWANNELNIRLGQTPTEFFNIEEIRKLMVLDPIERFTPIQIDIQSTIQEIQCFLDGFPLNYVNIKDYKKLPQNYKSNGQFDMNLIDTINEIKRISHQYKFSKCDIGTCDDKMIRMSDMINPCGNCSFMACQKCIIDLFDSFKSGTVSGIRRFLCACGSPFSETVIIQLSTPKLLQFVNASYNELKKDDDRIGYCLNGAKCRGNVYTILPKHNADVCEAGNPDDNIIDYRCSQCQTEYELAEIARAEQIAKLEKEKLLMENYKHQIQQSLKTGEIARKHQCGAYCTIAYKHCAKIHCPHCKQFFCWICMATFETSEECYAHIKKNTEKARNHILQNYPNKIGDDDWCNRIIPHFGPNGVYFPSININTKIVEFPDDLTSN